MSEADAHSERRKLTRSRTSCLKCRARKARCGGEPPNSCDYCSKRGLTCIWPKEDGRTARFLPHQERVSTGGSGPLGTWTTSVPVEPWDGLPDTILDPTPDTELDQSWRNWLIPTPGQSPSFTGQALGLNFTDTDGFLQSLLGDQSNVQVQLLVDGSTPPKHWHNDKTGIMRIQYRRPHGRTAFVPGNLAVPIKVVLKRNELPRTTPPADSSTFVHLIDVYQSHIHSQFPGIDCDELKESIKDPVPSFLLNCVAAVSARFSTDPRVALPSSKPEAYGDVFYERANAMLGDVMKIPLRETVMGFVLLACCAVTGQWMMTGNATRMATDLGLQYSDPPAMDPETKRLNRLCFWSVLLLDYMSSLGVGRSTSLRPESITQSLPTQEDMKTSLSPFPAAVAMLHASGPLINTVNSDGPNSASTDFILSERSSIMRQYQELPAELQWSTTNLRLHNNAGQGAMFFHLHVWVHTVLSRSIWVPDESLDELSRSGAKLIGEYLTLCDVVNPAIYYTQPFLGQPLFTAATVTMSELRRRLGPTSDDTTSNFLSSIAHTQIDTIKRAIRTTSVYWRGSRLVETALDECIRTDTERDKIWVENESYAVEVYDWSLPDRYRADGAQVN